mmetsp:Transcript_1994/g.4458  ORF Transcript_1994/g.4458 Transcript_1994/m.4458 type:complete len:202 (-) Transcript_1994:19-624(-)
MAAQALLANTPPRAVHPRGLLLGCHRWPHRCCCCCCCCRLLLLIMMMMRMMVVVVEMVTIKPLLFCAIQTQFFVRATVPSTDGSTPHPHLETRLGVARKDARLLCGLCRARDTTLHCHQDLLIDRQHLHGGRLRHDREAERANLALHQLYVQLPVGVHHERPRTLRTRVERHLHRYCRAPLYALRISFLLHRRAVELVLSH